MSTWAAQYLRESAHGSHQRAIHVATTVARRTGRRQRVWRDGVVWKREPIISVFALELRRSQHVKVSPVVRDIEESRWDEEGEDEATWWPRALWIDPGDVTGLSVVWFDPAALLAGLPTPRCVLAWQEEYINGDEDEQAAKILKFIGQIGGPSGLCVGIETFVIQQLNMSRSYLSPVRIRSKIEFGLYRGVREWDGEVRRRTAKGQSASDAKNAITDHRLKLWNMYTPGPDHIRDGTKHALLWLRRVRDQGPVFLRKHHGWEREWFEDA